MVRTSSLLLLLGALAQVAAASERQVAVLEMRNAVTQVQDLGERLAAILRRNTSLQAVDAREARRRMGVRLDEEVARCAGRTACLAEIGARLGVSEVLLLAVSQLGDVVLALQRIAVANRAVAGRVADSLPDGQEPDEARVLSWLEQLYPPEIFQRYGQIRVTTDVTGAQVYVNSKPRGQTPLHGPIQVLAPGHYRLLVEKPRYLPFQATLSVMPDTTVEVAAQLQREIRSTPWYRRWYLWVAVGTGAALAGGVALAAMLSRPPPDRTHVPGVIELR